MTTTRSGKIVEATPSKAKSLKKTPEKNTSDAEKPSRDTALKRKRNQDQDQDSPPQDAPPSTRGGKASTKSKARDVVRGRHIRLDLVDEERQEAENEDEREPATRPAHLVDDEDDDDDAPPEEMTARVQAAPEPINLPAKKKKKRTEKPKRQEEQVEEEEEDDDALPPEVLAAAARAAQEREQATVQRIETISTKRDEKRRQERRRALKQALLQGEVEKGPVRLQMINVPLGTGPIHSKATASVDAKAFLQQRMVKGQVRSSSMLPLAVGMSVGASIKMRTFAPAAAFVPQKGKR